MILAEALLLGLLFGLLTGGSLRGLQRARLRGEWLLLMLLPLQLAWPRVCMWLRLDCAPSVVMWLVFMGTLSFVLFLNARDAWMLAIAGLGIAANVMVIGLNGAMPVSLKAASETGLERSIAAVHLAQDCLHEPLDGTTALAPLSDVVPVPGPPWQRGVLSAGDVLLAAGLAAWVFTAVRSEHGRTPVA